MKVISITIELDDGAQITLRSRADVERVVAAIDAKRSDAAYHSRPKMQHPSSNSEFLGNDLHGYQYREAWERRYPEDVFPDAVRSMPKQFECHRGRVVSGHGRITSGGYD